MKSTDLGDPWGPLGGPLEFLLESFLNDIPGCIRRSLPALGGPEYGIYIEVDE